MAASNVYATLTAAIAHHSVGRHLPDLLVAAIAELAHLTVLHNDKDFELIAEITGQRVERLVDAA